MYDFREVMRLCCANGCVYFGHWPRHSDETAEAYMQRMAEVTNGGTSGMLLHFDEDLFDGYTPQRIQALWADRKRRREGVCV